MYDSVCVCVCVCVSVYDSVCVCACLSQVLGGGELDPQWGRDRAWIFKWATAAHPAPQLSLQNPNPCPVCESPHPHSQCRQASRPCWALEVATKWFLMPRPDCDSLSGRLQECSVFRDDLVPVTV